MSTVINGQAIQDILIAVALIGGSLLYWKSRVPNQTIKNLQDSNASYVALDTARQQELSELKLKLDDTIRTHNDEKLELTKAIADLQGQIKVYKELPLRELADGIKTIVNSNAQILQTLQGSTTVVAPGQKQTTHVQIDAEGK